MEKLKQPLRERLDPVVLYLDDLEKLVAMLKEVCKTIELRTDEYRLKNLKELLQLNPPRIAHLIIQSPDPYILIDVQPEQVILYADNDTPAQRGVLEQIKAYLQYRDGALLWISLNASMAVVCLALALSLLVLSMLSFSRDHNYLALLEGVTLLLLSSLWIWWPLKGVHARRVIHLETKSHAPNFFQRKKDELILSLIAALIGALIAFVVTHFPR